MLCDAFLCYNLKNQIDNLIIFSLCLYCFEQQQL